MTSDGGRHDDGRRPALSRRMIGLGASAALVVSLLGLLGLVGGSLWILYVGLVVWLCSLAWCAAVRRRRAQSAVLRSYSAALSFVVAGVPIIALWLVIVAVVSIR